MSEVQCTVTPYKAVNVDGVQCVGVFSGDVCHRLWRSSDRVVAHMCGVAVAA